MLEIFIKKNLSLLAVFGLLPLSKNFKDVLLKKIRVRVSDVDQFQGVFYCDFISAGKVVHEELHQVEEITGFESSLVENAPFVHKGEFILIDLAIKIFIDFPNPLVDLGFAEGETEFGENSDDILLVDGEAE